MRLFHAAALAAAALFLTSVASAQGIGDAAAKEKSKQKTTAPAKVYTESDIGGGSVAAPPPAAEPAAGAAAGEGAAASGEAKPKSEADQEKEAAERKAKEEAAWRDELDRVRKAEQAARTAIDDIQTQLNDVSTMYTPSRARAVTALEEAKKKQAELQARVAALEAEGSSKGYR